MNKRLITGISIVIIIAVAIIAFKLGLKPETSSNLDDDAFEGAIVALNIDLKTTADKNQREMIDVLVNSGHADGTYSDLEIEYPVDESVFPPEMVAPAFLWKDPSGEADAWLIDVAFESESGRIYQLTDSKLLPPPKIDRDCISDSNELPVQNYAKNWTPDPSVWTAIKKNSLEKPAIVSIYGFNRNDPDKVLSSGQVRITTSRDPVGAPIFYRDVPLMPTEVEATGLNSLRGSTIQPLPKGALPLIAWRLRDISRPESRVVLKDMPSCANCHSFSSDGGKLGMDIDGSQDDKGAYAITSVSKNMVIDRTDLISWNFSSKEKPKGKKTIGFLSRISPDGKHVMSTVNESVFVVNYLNYEFLQVFYPTRGILAHYSQETGKFKFFPGADDPDYVHCDPVWTPDGKNIIFARAKAKNRYKEKQVRPEFANAPDETQIQYDLYRIPFNNGKGGIPEPVEGASNNGISNNFPKVSPDGRFIVFVKCRNGQLMRPDSRLWIVPIEGGEAREMTCNTTLMNSWHSFSPNSRWLVFSSKANTYYTQMFLTHIDENGNDSPPILIPNSTADNRAVNIPEFVNIRYDDMMTITVPAVSHHRYVLQASALVKNRRFDEAIEVLQKALKDEKEDMKFRSQIYSNLGGLVFRVEKNPEKALGLINESIRIDPEYSQAYFTRGIILESMGKDNDAIQTYKESLELDPQNFWAINRLAHAHLLSEDDQVRNTGEALRLAKQANELSSYREPALLEILAGAYSEKGDFTHAVDTANSALEIARNAGRNQQAARIVKEIELYRQKIPITSLDIPVP